MTQCLQLSGAAWELLQWRNAAAEGKHTSEASSPQACKKEVLLLCKFQCFASVGEELWAIFHRLIGIISPLKRILASMMQIKICFPHSPL